MDPLNKAEEIASAWKALAVNSRSDEGWMTIPGRERGVRL